MSPRPLNIAIIGANPTSANLGVGALGYSQAHLVSLASKKIHRPVNIDFVGVAGSLTELDLCDRKLPITMRAFYNLKRLKSLVKACLHLRRDILPLFGYDLVLDIGEGDSFSDIYGLDRFRQICASKSLFRKLGKRQILMPQTIGPFSDPKVEAMAVGLMKSMTVLLARDRKSKNVAETLLGAGTCEEITDCAFALPFSKAARYGEGVHVGLNVSALLVSHSGDKNYSFGTLAAPYPELIDRLIDQFLSKPDVHIHLVPHVFGPGAMGVEDDRMVSEAILARRSSDRIRLAPPFADPCRAKSYISGLDFFLGARMHACIAAFSSGVAVVPMAYSRKFSGLFEETLGYSQVVDLPTDSAETILAKVEQAFDERSTLTKQIAETMNTTVKKRIDRLIEILKEQLGNIPG